jgi:hypothetical protein
MTFAHVRTLLAGAVVMALLVGACTAASPSPSAVGTAPGSGTAPAATPSTVPAKPTAAPTTAPTAPDPVPVVQAFYDWYLTDQDFNHLLVRPELTPAFVDKLRQDPLMVNPIVCAQDVPTHVTAVAATTAGSSATVTTSVSFNNAAEMPGPTVALVLTDGSWHIDDVDCGS